MNVEGVMIRTYFQSLSDELLEVLLSFALKENREGRELVLAPSHPLQPAFKNAFSRLHMNGETVHPVRFDELRVIQISLNSVTAGWYATIDKLKAVVTAMKDSTTALELSNIQWMTQDIPQICQFLSIHCSHVTELKISHKSIPESLGDLKKLNEVLHILLSVFAAQLTSLSCSFACRSYAAAAVLLASIDDRVMPLKKLSLTGSFNVRVFESMALKCGETLEFLELDLNDKDEWEKAFDVIERKCPKLNKLLLKKPTFYGVPEEQYVSLLGKFGHQLTLIDPDGLSADGLRCLRNLCPNLRLSLRIEENDMNWDLLNGTGEIMRILTIPLLFHHDFGRLSRLLAGCHHLVKLHLKYHSEEPAINLESIVSSSLPELEDLILEKFQFSACISIIEKCSNRLKELTLTTSDIIRTFRPFESIVRRARNLRIVYIEDGWGENTWGRPKCNRLYINTVQCFLDCKELSELSLLLDHPVSVDELRAVCLPFRRRGVTCLFHSEYRKLLEVRNFSYF